MSVRVIDAIQTFKRLNYEIEAVLEICSEDGENLIFDSNDPNECFLRAELISILDKLESVHTKLTYLTKPVVEEGRIYHNSAKRYELPSGYYFTSGSVCEILTEIDDEVSWVYTSIEHSGDDYYATALGKGVSIDGMLVRIRK